MSRSLEWMDHAACRGADPALFFPTGKRTKYTEAKRICAACPVRQQCADHSQEFEQGSSRGQREGVWGGMSPSVRAARARAAGLADMHTVRRQQILHFHAEGLTAKAIAERLRCHERTVMRITAPLRNQQQEEAA